MAQRISALTVFDWAFSFGRYDRSAVSVCNARLSWQAWQQSTCPVFGGRVSTATQKSRSLSMTRSTQRSQICQTKCRQIVGAPNAPIRLLQSPDTHCYGGTKRHFLDTHCYGGTKRHFLDTHCYGGTKRHFLDTHCYGGTKRHFLDTHCYGGTKRHFLDTHCYGGTKRHFLDTHCYGGTKRHFLDTHCYGGTKRHFLDTHCYGGTKRHFLDIISIQRNHISCRHKMSTGCKKPITCFY